MNFPGVNFYCEFLDSGDGIFDFFADFRGWRKWRIPKPIMPHHSIFIRIGNGS